MAKKAKTALAALAIVAWLTPAYVFMWPPIVWEFQSARNACVNNRRQIEAAVEQWALENRKTNGDLIVMSEVAQYLKGMPICPEGGTYICRFVGDEPICSLRNVPPRKIRVSPFLYELSPSREHYR